MVTVQDVYSCLDSFAPVRYQMDFDNAGYLVGSRTSSVHCILAALDITDDVIAEAVERKADLIVSHHPLIFHPLKNIRSEDLTGRKILMLAKHDIAAICMHTNLDIAFGGVNDALMDILGAETTGLLEPAGTDDNGEPLGCGRIGSLPKTIPLTEFLPYLCKKLPVSGLRYVSGGKPVKKIAVCGGSGGSLLELAYENGCDTMITADIKYDRFLAAKEYGINLIDADHFCTENVVIPVIVEKLRSSFPSIDVYISDRLRQTVQFFTP